MTDAPASFDLSGLFTLINDVKASIAAVSDRIEAVASAATAGDAGLQANIEKIGGDVQAVIAQGETIAKASGIVDDVTKIKNWIEKTGGGL